MSFDKASYDAAYATEKTRQIKLKLNLKHDADILAALDATANKQGYIKSLIRADIAKKE